MRHVRSRREAACEAERWEERFNIVEEASKQLCAESLGARGAGAVVGRLGRGSMTVTA